MRTIIAHGMARGKRHEDAVLDGGGLVLEKRYLIVTADDYGIGPATSAGILELALQGRISASVLLVNSPYAEAAVTAWRQAANPRDLGWHPCLTLDSPILPQRRVPSLVDEHGRFWRLGAFLRRLFLGRIQPSEVKAELDAQYSRYKDLVGHSPQVVNSHHHVQVFGPIGAILNEVLQRSRPKPYVRRIHEPWSTLLGVRGARIKRFVLSSFGSRQIRRQGEAGFPGNDWLVGVTDPPWVHGPHFFANWLRRVPGRIVELTCHPGHLDPTLVGRDCTASDGHVQRRFREWDLLRAPAFEAAYKEAGFTLVSPSALLRGTARLIAA